MAGDVAEFYDVNAQRHRNVGNWMNALMQGRCVAKNMTGQETKFELVSSYATNALGLEIVFIGDTSREHADDISVEGSVDSGSVSQLFYRGERLVGAVLIGDTKQRTELTKQMQKE